MLLNPLRMNDWRIGATLKGVAVVLCALWALVALETWGIALPLVRGVVGTACLLFVPGILVLRVARMHHLGSVRTALFSVGLSIVLVMFMGLFMNAAYPLVGISRPLTSGLALLTLSAVIIALGLLSYARDRQYAGDECVLDRADVFSPPVLLLCLVPFASVLATYVMNAYQSNVALLGLIVGIGVVIAWVGISPSFPRRWYPLAVFVVALALLYHTSLISSYPWGWDVQQELFQANAVLARGAWDINAPGGLNAVISITLLAPLSTLITGVSSVWVLKALYPLVFALVPLGLFSVFKKQTNERIAFLAAAFVPVLFTFFTEMPAIARQEIAELFVVLLLMLMVDKAAHRAVGTKATYALLALFTFALIVSHYMVALVFLAYLAIAWLVLFLVDNPAMRRLGRSRPTSENGGRSNGRTVLSAVFIAAFALFTCAWYTTLGTAVLSSMIEAVTNLISFLVRSGILPFALALGIIAYAVMLGVVYLVARRNVPTQVPGLHVLAPIVLATALITDASALVPHALLDIGTLSPLHEISRGLYLLSLALVIIGLGALSTRRFRFHFDQEYVALAIAGVLLLLGWTLVPYLAFAVGTTRLFHLSSLFIAPFFVTGVLFFAHAARNSLHTRADGESTDAGYRIVAVILVITLLFNTGFMYEVFQQDPTSVTLSNSIDGARFSAREVSAAQWLYAVRSPGDTTPVYADAYRVLLWASIDFPHYASEIPVPANETPHDAYVFLGTFNLATDQTAQTFSRWSILNGTVIRHVDLNDVTDGRARLFDNGAASVYYH